MKDASVRDFLAFRRMLTPIIVIVMFWLGLAACLIAGIVTIVSGVVADYGGGGKVLVGLLTIVLGPIFVRLWCELAILFFRINETLTDIKNSIAKDKSPDNDQGHALL